MRYFLLFLSMAAALLAADKDFNGRWDIKVLNEPRSRVWWLEVQGAGTPAVKGLFVGAPGGDMDTIPEIKVANNTLEFVFSKRYQRGNANPVRGVYTAKIVNGKLIGSLDVPGSPTPRAISKASARR